MILSEILNKLGINYRMVGPDEFDSLGLASYNNGYRTCTFVESDKYVDGLSPNISLVLTKESVADYLKKFDRALAYVQ